MSSKRKTLPRVVAGLALTAACIAPLLAATASPTPASPPASAPSAKAAEPLLATKLSDEAKQRIAIAVQTAAGRAQYRGCFVVAIADDAVLCSGRGVRIPEAPHDRDGGKPIDDQSIFEIASISKPFTAIAIMQLVEQGKIDLDAPIIRYLGDDMRFRECRGVTRGAL